ncbi:MAG: ABC transporter permease [Actinomycetota bacterium]
MSVTVSRPDSPTIGPASAIQSKRKPRWWRDPWRKPRILETVTWMYLVWSISPVAIAVLISFNAGRSISTFQGFGLLWWNQDPESLFKDPNLHTAIFQTLKLSLITMLIAVPLGVMFAIGIDRWRGRPARTANFVMLLSFVMPEIIIGVAMFLVFQYLFKFIRLGTMAELLGLITFQLSYPVIIVRARLLSIGKEYEEAALDLGAPPRQSIRRVLLPLLYPAIFASFALVFADTIDDFVTVNYLHGLAPTEPLAVKIYTSARGSPTPAVNAAATLMLFSTTVVIVVGFLLYRHFTKGQRAGMHDFAAQI